MASASGTGWAQWSGQVHTPHPSGKVTLRKSMPLGESLHPYVRNVPAADANPIDSEAPCLTRSPRSVASHAVAHLKAFLTANSLRSHQYAEGEYSPKSTAI